MDISFARKRRSRNLSILCYCCLCLRCQHSNSGLSLAKGLVIPSCFSACFGGSSPDHELYRQSPLGIQIMGMKCQSRQVFSALFEVEYGA